MNLGRHWLRGCGLAFVMTFTAAGCSSVTPTQSEGPGATYTGESVQAYAQRLEPEASTVVLNDFAVYTARPNSMSVPILNFFAEGSQDVALPDLQGYITVQFQVECRGDGTITVAAVDAKGALLTSVAAPSCVKDDRTGSEIMPDVAAKGVPTALRVTATKGLEYRLSAMAVEPAS